MPFADTPGSLRHAFRTFRTSRLIGLLLVLGIGGSWLATQQLGAASLRRASGEATIDSLIAVRMKSRRDTMEVDPEIVRLVERRRDLQTVAAGPNRFWFVAWLASGFFTLAALVLGVIGIFQHFFD